MFLGVVCTTRATAAGGGGGGAAAGGSGATSSVVLNRCKSSPCEKYSGITTEETTPLRELQRRRPFQRVPFSACRTLLSIASAKKCCSPPPALEATRRYALLCTFHVPQKKYVLI